MGVLADYQDGDTVFEGYVAGGGGIRKPCVLVAHQWAGQSNAERGTADRLAESGYLAVAIDVYGKGQRGEHGTPNAMAVNSALMQPLMQDRAMLRRRLLAAVEFAKERDDVDASRIAIVGYCLGGLCALDLARSGTKDIKGAVSLHGVFSAPNIGFQSEIKASILVLHGWEDPLAPPHDVLDLARELTEAKADWQLHGYGHAMHSFTNKEANQPANGQQYNAKADARSWQAMTNFLKEVLV